MIINIHIDDAAVPAFEAYLATQITASVDPVSKKGKITPHFSGVDDFVQKQIANIVTYVTTNFPQ